MLAEIKKKVLSKISLLIIAMCIVFYYFYCTRPMEFDSLINKGTIKEISISQNNQVKFPQNLKFDDKQDFDAIVNILNKYKYSKNLNFRDGWLLPVSANPTNGAIGIFITYLSTDNNFENSYVFVDAEDDTIINYIGHDHNRFIEYRINGKSDDLFSDLEDWISMKQ